MQKEIDSLKEKGVNKIIVLSHAGYNADVELAQSVEGIDVIIGGHTHNLIKGIKENKVKDNYDGSFEWSPDELAGHAFRILTRIQRINDTYQNDYTEYLTEDEEE